MDPLLQNDQLAQRDESEPINYEADEQNIYKGKFTKYLLICLLIAVAGSAFQYGWSIAIFNTPSDVIKDFYKEVYNKTHGEEMDNNTLNSYWSITNGLLPLGGIFGGFSSGFMADHFGRKTALLLVNIIVVISATLNTISKPLMTYYTIFGSRFLAGVYSGLFSGILPLYLSECSCKNQRGLTGAMNQLSIVIGILVANIVGLKKLLGTSELWPILTALTFVPVILHFGLLFTPESPKYLFINRNNKTKAEEILVKFRDNDMNLVNKELEELEEEKEKLETESKGSWGDLFTKRPYVRALIVTVGIQIAQQLSGINAVIFYSTDIFKNAGLKDDWPVYATIILGVVQIIMTIVCMLVVDRAGRKILLLIGMSGMSVFSFLLAVCRIFGNDSREWLNYMTVVCAVLYIVFFSIGPGAIPWLITAELFSSDVRGKATSLAVLVNWSSNLLLTVTFPFIEAAIGSYSFLIFGVLLIFFATFVFFFVPETKNRHIEEIVAMFNEKFIFSPRGN